MKKIILIPIIILIGFLQKTNAQVPDTLAYLKSIVNKKSFYIGKPFSVLRDSLKIQIKFFSPFGSIPYDKNKETSTTFSFYFPQAADETYLTYPRLDILWYPYLNVNQSTLLFNQYNGNWVPSVKSFYATGIIADIRILE